MNASRTSLIAVILFALIVRLGWVLHSPADKGTLGQLPDQVEYYKIAENLLIGKGFHFWDERFDGDVHAFRMPGYPLFVAACGGKLVIVRIAQALIDTSTVFAMYLLARRLLNHRAALLAAILVGCNPFLIYFSGLMLSETLFVSMLAWGMVCIACNKQKSIVPLIGLFVVALSVHIRPSAMLLPIFLPLVLRRSWVQSLAGAAMVAVVLLPWGIRNKNLLGEWIWTTTNSGVTFYDGFNPSATGASDQSFLKTMPQLKTMGEVERSRYLAARAQNYIATNLPRVVSLTGTKIVRTWSPVPLSEQFGSRWLYRLVGGGYSIILFGLVVWSVFASTLPRHVKLYLLTTALYFTVVHALSVGSLRYRLPAEPPMSVLACAAMTIQKRDRITADCRLSTAD